MNYNPQQNGSLPRVNLGAFLNATGSERREMAKEVDEICRTIGFLVIENHGVADQVCLDAWGAAESFFKSSQENKKKAQPNDPACPRGYLPIEGENLSKTIGEELPPDRKETFSSGPLALPTGHEAEENFDFFYGPNIWPAEPDEFEQYWTRYYQSMEKLGAQIMSMLAVALDMKQDYFVPFHTHHISALRSQNYPSLKTKILPGQLRAGAHSDYGSVTILRPDPHVDGLEVKSPNGGWIKAPIVTDGFIINIGDLLARWTNDRWVSTLHRVVEPQNCNEDHSPRRQSIAYFMNPNYDAQIETIPTCLNADEQGEYPPVFAGQYLINKYSQST